MIMYYISVLLIFTVLFHTEYLCDYSVYYKHPYLTSMLILPIIPWNYILAYSSKLYLKNMVLQMRTYFVNKIMLVFTLFMLTLLILDKPIVSRYIWNENLEIIIPKGNNISVYYIFNTDTMNDGSVENFLEKAKMFKGDIFRYSFGAGNYENFENFNKEFKSIKFSKLNHIKCFVLFIPFLKIQYFDDLIYADYTTTKNKKDKITVADTGEVAEKITDKGDKVIYADTAEVKGEIYIPVPPPFKSESLGFFLPTYGTERDKKEEIGKGLQQKNKKSEFTKNGQNLSFAEDLKKSLENMPKKNCIEDRTKNLNLQKKEQSSNDFQNELSKFVLKRRILLGYNDSSSSKENNEEVEESESDSFFIFQPSKLSANVKIICDEKDKICENNPVSNLQLGCSENNDIKSLINHKNDTTIHSSSDSSDKLDTVTRTKKKWNVKLKKVDNKYLLNNTKENNVQDTNENINHLQVTQVKSTSTSDLNNNLPQKVESNLDLNFSSIGVKSGSSDSTEFLSAESSDTFYSATCYKDDEERAETIINNTLDDLNSTLITTFESNINEENGLLAMSESNAYTVDEVDNELLYLPKSSINEDNGSLHETESNIHENSELVYTLESDINENDSGLLSTSKDTANTTLNKNKEMDDNLSSTSGSNKNTPNEMLPNMNTTDEMSLNKVEKNKPAYTFQDMIKKGSEKLTNSFATSIDPRDKFLQKKCTNDSNIFTRSAMVDDFVHQRDVEINTESDNDGWDD